jgi:putative effector of murein hydrolase LrgA (UPF0299 family)
MNARNAVLAIIVTAVCSFVYHSLTCGWIFNWVYKIPPSHIWRSPEQMGGLFFLWVFLSTLLFCALFTIVYTIIQKGLPAEEAVNKGLLYGFFVWMLAGVPAALSMKLWTIAAPKVTIYQLINSLVHYLIIGAVLGTICREKREEEEKEEEKREEEEKEEEKREEEKKE